MHLWSKIEQVMCQNLIAKIKQKKNDRNFLHVQKWLFWVVEISVSIPVYLIN